MQPWRYRLAFAGGLVVIITASWAWLGYQDWAMRHMDIAAMAMPSAGVWTWADLALVFSMWAVMMVAMMLPTATPMLLIYRRVVATRPGAASPQRLTAAFAAAYVAVWTIFSFAATLAQWGLHSGSLISSAMVVTNPIFGGALLIAAGIYQWTPLKNACLAGCRSPLGFLLNHWREGVGGALRMGAIHGVYCTGCCWLLMALLFVFGVMNLAWIVVLTAFVLTEKLLPPSRWLARISGTVLIAWGVAVAVFGTI
jgi:predicted metal-binding membrane protein